VKIEDVGNLLTALIGRGGGERGEQEGGDLGDRTVIRSGLSRRVKGKGMGKRNDLRGSGLGGGIKISVLACNF